VKDLSDQSRAAIFFVTAIAIFLVWSHFFMPAASTPSQLNQKATNSQVAVTTSPGQGQSAAAAPTVAPAAPATVPAIQAKAETLVVLESPVYRVEISNRGGVAQSWQLQKYFDDQKPPHPLDLVNKESATELGWPLSLMLDDPTLEAEANSALYQITPSGGAAQAPAEVTMQWSDGHLSVTKKLAFKDGYDTDIEVSVTLDGKPIPFAIAWRGEFGDKAVYQAAQLVTVFYSQNGKLATPLTYKKLGFAGNQIQPYEQGGPMDFAGVEDQFFAAAFIPGQSGLALWDWTQWHHYEANGQSALDPEAQIAAGPLAPGTFTARLFIGPKDLQILSQQQPSLEGLINFGWTGIIAKPLLFALEWLHRFIPNYGWTIVILTLLLNMILFPVKMASFKSARKMQLVAPEIKAIQDRYKKYSMRDPRKQKMNEEVMAVYQREGINPAAGCLPMLPQLLILWAFWRVLAYSIVLRHEPWIGWIHDLSARDPYYILPVGMAVTAFLMQKLTPMPATVDPAQQRMMMLMPLFFVVLLFRYASGLNLYYFTANLVGAAQQWYLNRANPLPSRSKFKKNRE
jgi:YidC/Oxa1 family membrane protein insertase